MMAAGASMFTAAWRHIKQKNDNVVGTLKLFIVARK
jgi:hypothetical protein